MMVNLIVPPVYAVLCFCHFSHVQFFAAPWTVAHEAPLSMGILQARILEWVAIPFSRGSSGIEPRSPILYCHEPQGKPMNTGVDSLSLL